MNAERKYDLEERTEKFSLRVRDLCRQLKQDIINREFYCRKVLGEFAHEYHTVEAAERVV